MVADPKILGAPPPDSSAGASAAPSAPGQQPPAGAPADPSRAAPAATGPTADQLAAAHFETAAARAGLDEKYAVVAYGLFMQTGQEPTKANMSKFVESLKTERPALFGPQPANTAPVPAHAVPAAPAPGAISNPFQTWRSLVSAGRKAEAEAFYQTHRRAIHRIEA